MVWPTENIPTYGRGVWLECNGQSFSTTQFPQLYEALGTNRVPNYQGVFLRGYGEQDYAQLNGFTVTFDDPVYGSAGKLTYGQPTNTNYASGNIGEIQGDSSRRFVTDLSSNVFQLANEVGSMNPLNYNAIRLDSNNGIYASGSAAWSLVRNGNSNVIRAWGHFYDTNDRYWGDIYNQKKIFFSFNPKHYKYNMSCSEDSCSLEEYTEPAEDDEGVWTYAWASDIGMDSYIFYPTANEFRPVNIAVKFMIKAK